MSAVKPVLKLKFSKPAAAAAAAAAAEPAPAPLFRVRMATLREVEDLPSVAQTQDLTAMSAKVPEAAAAPTPKPKPQPLLQKPKVAAAAKPQATAQAIASFPEDIRPLATAIYDSEHANKYTVQTPVYPLQTRRGFNRQILKVFREFVQVPEYGKAPDFDACKRLGAGAQEQLEMYEYQKFVRDYVRQATPYRGLLVYHGLGSGKTCSAIAAAEAMFGVSGKRIIVMTPFSLRDNFIREVTFCGFRHFRLQNHWISLDPSPTNSLFATQILGLPQDYVNKATSIWVPDFDKEPNLAELSAPEKAAIQKQLFAQINSRITFINYNGITASKLKEMACSPAGQGGQGPFDNAIIVVDEIHNLTRLMQGTIEPYLTTLPTHKTRTIPLEPITPGHWTPALCKKAYDPRRPYQTNYKRGYLLYRLLATARNSKIIGLSGTPLINFPEEVAILMNLLGGYIHTATFSIEPGTVAPTKAVDTLRSILKEHPFVDFERTELAGLSIRTLFTLLPEGTRKVRDAAGEVGAERLPPGTASPTIEAVLAEILDTATKKGFKTVGNPDYKSEPLLPPIGDEFRASFLTPDGKSLKNTVVLRKRIQGLVSYYRGSKKELMPTVTRDEIVRVPFTPYAQGIYSLIRKEEIEAKLKQKTEPAGDAAAQAAAGSRVANLWAELYNLAKMKSPNSYRMASRQACNFAFPEGIARPRPGSQVEAIEEAGGKGEDAEEMGMVDARPVEEDAIVLALEAEVEAAAASAAAAAAAEAEDYAIEESATRDAVEKAKEQGSATAAAIAAELAEEDTILVKGRDAVPAGEVAPVAVVAVAKPKTKAAPKAAPVDTAAATAALAEIAKTDAEVKKGAEARAEESRKIRAQMDAIRQAKSLGATKPQQGGVKNPFNDDEEEEEEAPADAAAVASNPFDEEEEAEEEEAEVAAPEPVAEVAAAPAVAVAGLTAANKLRLQRKEQQEACKAGFRDGEKYMDATKRAKKCLETFATPRLRLYPMGKKAIQESAAGAPLLATGLVNYSPKFAAILTRILESPGSSLVYSQFLDMEGIGIFQTVLRINDFLPLTLESDEAGSFRFSESTLKGLARPNTYRYLSFTGAESREQKAMALRVFNARYNEEKKAFIDLPASMSAALVAAGFTGNLRGEICRVFCITSAGAEGLSLRNVRRVHIMEPYWNHVRTDQVKGRAVRICSHIDLEYNDDPTKNERTVEVFTYCSVFHPSAMTASAGVYPPVDMTIVNTDGVKPAEAKDLDLPVPEGARDYVMTSDEYLYVLSESKKKLLKEIQDLMKTSAVDCQINEYENEEEGLGCLTLPGSSEDYAFDPDLKRDITDTATAFEKVEAAAAPAAAPVAAPAVAAAAAPAPAQKPVVKAKAPTVKAYYINDATDTPKYLAIPVVGPGGAVLSYKVYAAGDTKAKKLLGTTIAMASGAPSSKIDFI